MGFAEWLAAKHPMVVHLPIGSVLLLPIALIAAQRMGRGIKPWRLTCRYLAWMGVLGSFCAILSGWLQAKQNDALPTFNEFFTRFSPDTDLFRWHQLLAFGGFVVGLACLKSMYQRKEEHEGIGLLPLLLGFLWAGVLVYTGYYGSLMRPFQPIMLHKKAILAEPPPPPPPPFPPDHETKAPWRALNYASLVPMHAKPVLSRAHGNRWIRVWVSPEAKEAYENGVTLPPDSLVVMNSFENKWGRPSTEEGPLYALETKAGNPFLTFYWPRVPVGNREETDGADRAYYRGKDPKLQSCMACHANGLAPIKDRRR